MGRAGTKCEDVPLGDDHI